MANARPLHVLSALLTAARRRGPSLRTAALALACLLSPLAHAFGLDEVSELARQRAAAPYRDEAASIDLPTLNYDTVRRIRFRPEYGLWRGTGYELQFFPTNGAALPPVRVHEVVGGQSRQVRLPEAAFDRSDPLLPPAARSGSDIAGVRLVGPLNRPDKLDEIAAFVGASYFRALGRGQVYGASARGIAVDTTGAPGGEEFPRFTDFWFEKPAPGAREVVMHALLDGPRITGAYRFVLQPGDTTKVDVRSRLFLRAAVSSLGVAPLTSMFLSGENQPAATDFRPEVHDSDGLLVATSDGSWLWRPLINPRAAFVTSFALDSPKGFGLLQRDRGFGSYEDLEAHYQQRPSVWVEPLSNWGAGRVELLQFHTPDETHDNVVAYWVPQRSPQPGQPIELAYRLHWQTEGQQLSPGLAKVLQTRSGYGWRPKTLDPRAMQLHIDFAGEAPRAASAAAAAPARLRAVVSGNANVEGLKANLVPHTERGGWRMTLDFLRRDPGMPVELRAELRDERDRPASETWTYALPPE